ncbi:hypothetical protein TcWFU_001222 [Taenia crassiceps]|uniref:Uncharacterized protein n=1 Tax=Taenia crassiceps TaxID=6207 RepID=A0ABR4QFL9_9CEST
MGVLQEPTTAVPQAFYEMNPINWLLQSPRKCAHIANFVSNKRGHTRIWVLLTSPSTTENDVEENPPEHGK